MNKRFALCVVVAGLLLLATGCSSQIVRVPIDPYVSPDLPQRSINRVAVLPVVVPDYLIGSGGETISVEITNQFIARMATQRLYNLVAGDRVSEALAHEYGNPRDWLVKGTIAGALKIGRQLQTDAVIYGHVKRYVQTNLAQSEVEIEFQLVDVNTMETVWSVRELMIGKGGSATLNEPVTSPPTRQLASRAVDGVAERVGQIYQEGGPIEVSTVSTRQIWGYSLLSAGAVSTVAAGYYFTMSYNAYRHYQDADSAADLSRYKDDTEQYDQMWMIFGGAGAALLGTGTYLLLTDPARQYAEGEADEANRIAVIPMVTPNSYLLGASWRF